MFLSLSLTPGLRFWLFRFGLCLFSSSSPLLHSISFRTNELDSVCCFRRYFSSRARFLISDCLEQTILTFFLLLYFTVRDFRDSSSCVCLLRI
ncbi:hypothetical protein BDN72DRAFT_345767 [Pluteus cervinus]|uniref:Uncharacterized protein n=1 Tax=Pluteus cervinus TaxID=181527 RepID=A0ACD3ADK9_9AGAR|nr:hypothetical protein BDN72DRAFT_345767 [Pluteus cervinus]